MKIAQVTYLFEPAVGGVETHILNIGSQLVKWGHEVDVITSDFLALNGLHRVVPGEERIRGMRVLRIKARSVGKTKVYSQRIRFPGVLKVLFSGGYDVIHCHSIASLHFDLAFLVSRVKGIPLVVTGHYSPGDLDRLWSKRRNCGPFRYPTARLLYWRTWMRFALKRVSAVVAIAESEKDRMVRYLGIAPEKVVVIPNGVDPSEFDSVDAVQAENFRDSHCVDADEPLVLFVGRISRVKGPDILAEAAAMVLAKGVKARFMLAGHPEDEDLVEALRTLAEDPSLDKGLQLADLPRHELLQAFKAADVVVLPSRGEVFGITLVEGMYCGKIVIGSDSGGIPEVISDGADGFLFKSGDPADLARLLCGILTRIKRGEEDGLDSIRKAARDKVLLKYTWENSARKLLSLYEGIV